MLRVFTPVISAAQDFLLWFEGQVCPYSNGKVDTVPDIRIPSKPA